VADTTRATWDAYLFEMMGKVQEVYPSEAPLLSELSGFDAKAGATDRHSTVRRISKEMDGNRDIFSGRNIRHTIKLAGLPGGGNPSETGTWNVPIVPPTDEATLKLVRFLIPFSVSVDVERDSFDHSNALAVAENVKDARVALAKLQNLEFLGDGTNLNGVITDSATSLATTVSAATFNPDVLLPNTVWDVLTRATGADPGQGKRRKIASVNETTRVVTWDTAAQASDGGSGSIVHTSADGIYVPGSWSNAASGDQAPGFTAAQGLEQAAALTGVFEGIDKALVPPWQGTDGRNGVVTVLPLADTMLEEGIRRGRRSGIGTWDFGLGDPAAIDLWKQSKYSFGRFDIQVTTLKGGFSGIICDSADKPFPMIKDPMHKKGAIKLIPLATLQLYGDQKGPGFLDDTGSMWHRFTRSLPKEADLLDRVQLGVTAPNQIVFFNDLAVA
jgi:hypothetical protein